MPDTSLPIYAVENELIANLRDRRRLILQAPTGSGKSTQVPQMLLKHGLLSSGQVVILQPRRLAARMLAARVARELGVTLGEEVGYQIRFENVTSPKTKIRFVTEGILLRQLVDQPSLPGVQAILFDEFHERHLYGDITLARALDLQSGARPDLLMAVMSATLDTGILTRHLNPCAVVRTEGRTYPVDVEYLSRKTVSLGQAPWELAAEAFASHVRSGAPGDVLVFMPGSYEIHQTIEAIRYQPESKGCILLPLHGELPPKDQDAAVARYDQRKVVVATNVAETSLTIDGVRLVIDSGLARIPKYDPNRGINTLFVEKISASSSDQRAGRAGRTAPGRCIRLWTEQDHADRPAHELPEIQRLDLSEVVLTLKASGVNDLRAFRWLEAPNEHALADAESLLTDLGALDHAGLVTPVGRKMLAFPLHPRYGRMLLAAQEFGCVYQAALVAALTQGRDLLIRNPGREVESFRADLFGERASSDFWILMRAWTYAYKNQFRVDACRRAGVHGVTARQVGPLLEQFLAIAQREGLDTQARQVPDDALQRCILIGFSDRVARRLDQGTLRCEMVHGRKGVLARESAVHKNPLLVAAEVREVGGPGRDVNTIFSLATAIESDWLIQHFPEDFKTSPRVWFDSSTKRVYAEEQRLFRDLVLDARVIEPPPLDAASSLLAQEVLAGRLVLKNWDDPVEQWILRLNLLSKWCPDLELPAMGPAERQAVVEQICHGAFTYKEIKEREVKPAVRSWLSHQQLSTLDKYAPERLELPITRQPKVIYVADGPPYVSLRIQELFGIKALPKVAMGRVSVLLHILAPNMRPVQITQDLAGFWREHYPKIKQELQRKYPKHEWR